MAGFSNHTSPEGRDVELFSDLNNLSQLVKNPTHIPSVEGHSVNILDLFLTSHPERYEVNVNAPLGNSDHCTISAISPLETSPASPAAPKRLVWLYDRADWEGLNNFFTNFNWDLCFLDNNVNLAADMVSQIILLGMRSFIPSKMVSIKPKDRS